MPKLWTETIDAHRTALRDAVLDATATLVAEQGLVGLTMSQIADRAGIGRATLYKYFPDAQAVVTAWHERQVTRHLEQVRAAADPAVPISARLHSVLRAYALLRHSAQAHHDSDAALFLHEGRHVDEAHQTLRGFVRDLIAEGAREGVLRTDVSAAELSAYCLAALNAAVALPSRAAVDRLVLVTAAGLAPDLSARS
ncbi:TetR family transcriptional regulator [Hamadaea sp. NPDC051192]|uniref:TetR/AcrR family transcriptional regulator n=1 Tax=Hamadaea sp. NPDC051192 TaxID=3154940 RepID=UPI00341C9553